MRRFFLFTFFTIERLSEMPSLAFCGKDPWPAHERRLMAHMLPVPTRQISHPIAVFILMKTDDGLMHTRPAMIDLMSPGDPSSTTITYFDAAGVPDSAGAPPLAYRRSPWCRLRLPVMLQ